MHVLFTCIQYDPWLDIPGTHFTHRSAISTMLIFEKKKNKNASVLASAVFASEMVSLATDP